MSKILCPGMLLRILFNKTILIEMTLYMEALCHLNFTANIIDMIASPHNALPQDCDVQQRPTLYKLMGGQV